jgi:hypothetical protein
MRLVTSNMVANQTKQTTANSKSAKRLMFDSPESAALWFNIFNAVLLAGALLVAIGTWGTIKTAGIKERYSDERIAANEAETKRAVADSDTAKEGTAKANQRIAELNTETARLSLEAESARVAIADANERASALEADAAKARERTATLEKETEILKSKNLELETKVKARRLSGEDSAKLTEAPFEITGNSNRRSFAAV